MKKLLILVAALALAVPMFAQYEASRFPLEAGAGTTLNDDSCDIGVTPAATLLLPYFEVDFNSPSTSAVNTVFTITNTSRLPQIAHITVWTDWSVPVLDFNVFLTGYDVQGISLYDVIARGVLPGTSITPTNNHGAYSAANNANPAFLANATTTCASLPVRIPDALVAEVQDALTGDVYNFGDPSQGAITGCQVGGVHANAVGYLTIDVARTCSTTLPTTESYYTGEIGFDNVLIGDYQRINPTVTTGNYAGGETLVHIRAIPEGLGYTGADVTFPYTFYNRYTPDADPFADRRQPLPGVWAARFIEEEAGVGQDFETEFAIWREGVREPACPSSVADDNAQVPLTELVRFDERENATSLAVTLCRISPCPPGQVVSFPETGVFSTEDGTRFPADESTDLGGWMYMNLNHNALQSPTRRPATGSSNWVTIRMTAESRYGVDFAAAWLGNGCSGNIPVTRVSDSGSATFPGPIDNNPF